MKGSDQLSIGDLAERTGLSVSAIRFYETKGLVTPARNAGGRRCFLRADIRRLSFVLIAQEFGFTIAEIANQLKHLPNGRAPTKADWTRISRTFKSHLDRKIDTLTSLRDRLDGCIGCGCLSLANCRLYNPQDRARNKGRGPRYLVGDRPEIDQESGSDRGDDNPESV